MAGGFKKHRTDGPGKASESKGNLNASGKAGYNESGRENMRGGANYASGGKRDTAERIYRDNRK